MKTLVIDTATSACSIALFDGDAVAGAAHEEIGRGHAERLVPMIAALPGGGRADRILVDVGPGSFTGIRVGIAAARALALGWGASVTGYSSLALIALDAFHVRQSAEDFAVVIEGGHGEVFMQSFAGMPDFRSLDDMVSLKPEEAVSRLGRREAVGSGVDRLTDLPPTQRGARSMPCAELALLLPAAYAQLPPSPIYGRAPDAKPVLSDTPGGVAGLSR